ncbi:MAG TPA: DUF4199 domain-containing protein [Parvularcula sp.]|nr:DUF4199 domain-containing protein [Parvularcula sp.]HBS31818.1 DUF4199 domain-containing protein [Parvularcula sp.]HBS33970.1 DUF4199 domain-containing protein [Parvularcula sp.]
MGRIALVYGGIAGLIVVSSIVIGFLLGADHGDGGMLLGYLIMIVALTLIFLGVKQFRDRNNGGVIKFGPALLLGVMIAVVAGAFYVAGWEGYLAATNYTFMDSYVEHTLKAKEAAGLAGEALAREAEKLKVMAEEYKNPLFRAGITFLEIFPVGIVIALISAALLQNPKVLPARAR